MRRLRLSFLLVAALMPFAAGAQTHVSDYVYSTYTSMFSSIESTGTELSELSFANMSTQLILPFTFYYGQDTCSIVTPTIFGQIGIGTANPSTSPNVYVPNMSVIAPFAHAFDGSTAFDVFYEERGSAPNRSVVIEWHLSSADTSVHTNIRYQTVLYETGDIEMIYDTCEVADTWGVYVYLREYSANALVALSGTWASPSVQTVAPGGSPNLIQLSPTSSPQQGLTLMFSRVESNCLRPLNFICRSFSRPDSVCFGWNAALGTSQWEFRYDTIGTPVDSMRNSVTYLTDTFYVCTTMVAGGIYDAYVRTDCGGEMSFWEGPVRVTPGSYNMPATGMNTIYACGGMIYDNGGATGNYSNSCNSTLIIMPSSPDSVVVVQGTYQTEQCCDHIYIRDGSSPSAPLLFQGEGTGTIPQIASVSGPLTIVFVSDGSVVSSGFALQVSCHAAPQCRYANEATVSNIAGTSALMHWNMVGTTGMPDYFIVSLRNRDNPEIPLFEDTTTSFDYFFTYLDQLTNYTAYISTYCNGDTIFGDSVQFVTRARAGGMSDPSGTGTNQTNGVPVMSSWGNTFCQSIYTAEELTAMGVEPGPIHGVTYTWSTAGSYNKEIVLFMGHTNNTVFTSTSPLTGSMTQVYTGTRNTTDVGLHEYYFDTPFVWDGVHSIVLTSFVNQPAGASHYSSGFYGYSTSCGRNASLYAYKDNTAYTTSNLSSSSFYYSTSRPNVNFIVPPDTLVTCVAPNVVLTDVLPNSVSFRWAPGYQETSWDIYYKTQADSVWTTASLIVSDWYFTIYGLTPQTDYTIKVVPECGGDSIAATLNVTTPCTEFTTFPLTENFENFIATSTFGSPTQHCWHRITTSTSTFYPYVTTSYANSGSRSMYFYSNSAVQSYLVLPLMGEQLDTLQVSMALYKTSTNYNIKIGTMFDYTDLTTFQSIAEVTPTANNTWEMIEVPLRGANPSHHYIVLASYGGTSSIYLDDLEVNYIPTCPRPTNVTVTNVTANSATVHWSDPGVNYFEIEYGPAGFAHGTGTIVTSVDDSVNLYGLSHSRIYDIYVRGVCVNTDTSSWSFIANFNTLCGDIDSLPFQASFRYNRTGSTSKPYCWTCGGYSSYPFIADVTNSYDGTTHRSLNMYSYITSPATYASLPKLDSISYPIQNVQAMMTAWSNTAGNYLIAGVCLQPGDLTTFTPVDTIALTTEPSIYDVSFESVPGAGQYITLVSDANVSPNNVINSFYLDSIRVELVPSCQTPNRLESVNTTHNTATLGWNPRSYASQWQIEYGPHGYVFGTGTRVIATSNPMTITGLNPSTQYDFRIRTICGTGDTSVWSRQVGHFATRQIPAPVPYFYDFETPAEWENWQTNSNTTINWYRDTAAGDGTPGFGDTSFYSMFISADSGMTYSTDLTKVVNASAYRDIDFGPSDSSFTLSFRARAGGTPSAGYDGLMVFLVNPDIPVVASDANITSPWGMVNNLTPLVTVRLSPFWNTYTVVLDTLSGVRRLAFFWFNQSTSSTPYSGGPAAVDNIRISFIDCPRPAGVHTTQLSMTSATVAWYGPESANYHFLCRSRTGQIVLDDYVNTNSVHLTGLSPNLTYQVYVRRICSDTDSSNLSLNYSFTTKRCNETIFDTVADFASTTTSYYIPINNYYSYSYSQQIVTHDELSGPSSISAISFYYTNPSAAVTNKTNCTIYMGHTSLASFASTNNFVDPDSLRIVYTGSLNSTQGWNRFLLNYPFEYDGVHNLVIAIDDNSDAYSGTTYTFGVHNTPDNKSLAFYSDGVNPDPTSLTSLSAFTGTRTTFAYRNQMAFEFCPPTMCHGPVLLNPIIRPNVVTLRWRNTGSSYQVGYRLASTSSWIVNDLVTYDTFYVMNNVIPNTDYVYQVRQVCDSTGISGWEMGQFNSGYIPCLPPEGLRVTSVTHNKVDLRWDPEENNISYRLHVFNSYFDKYVSSYIAHKSVSGLDANMTYYAAVQTTCQDIDDPSEWSDTITFVTDFCPDVTNVTYSNLQGNSVDIDWTEGGRATQWEIQYGYRGFDLGNGFSVIADSHPYHLGGLIGENEYDIYVRAICGDDFFSEHWSEPITILTPFSSIQSATDDARIRLAPNPTSGDVSLTLPASGSAILVEVIDQAGRTQLTATLPAGTESTTLATSQLAQGAYFVRVTADSINAIKKLIVK